jgi:hypothetical protein
MAETQAADLWCSRCGQPARLTGGPDPGLPDDFRRAVHAATGQETGPYGHVADPVGAEPPHWRACRILTVEFGDLFTIEAWDGFLRADWRDLPAGAVAGHFEAEGEEAMRLRLKAAVTARPSAQAGDGTTGADR